MNPLLSAELLKLRTTRALYVVLGLVVVFAAGLPFLGAALAGSQGAEDLTARSLLDMVRGPVQPAGGAVLLLGLFLSAGEFRHRTVLLTRLAFFVASGLHRYFAHRAFNQEGTLVAHCKRSGLQRRKPA